MSESLLPTEVKPGEAIRAAHISRVFNFIKNHRQYSAGFVSGAFKLTRRTTSGVSVDTVNATAYCWITSSIPKVVSMDSSTFECIPGMLQVADPPTSGGVVLLKWNEFGTKLVPMKTNILDEDGNIIGERIVRRTAVNVSLTDIRASVDHPIIGKGAIEIVQLEPPTDGGGNGGGGGFFGTGESSGATEERFSIDNIMDFRALPGFEYIEAEETDEIQIPYHAKNSKSYRQDSITCGTET